MTYYQIDGKIYYINLTAVFNLVSDTPSEEKLVNTTITQYYGNEEESNKNGVKEIVESKSSLNETMNNVRYDFIRNLINVLLLERIDGDGISVGITHLNEMTFSQGICFNTLIENKILLEVENNE